VSGGIKVEKIAGDISKRNVRNGGCRYAVYNSGAF